MKVALAKFCFWFRPESVEAVVPVCEKCDLRTIPTDEVLADIVLEATPAGCYFDEYGAGVKDCPGGCNQMCILPGRTLKFVEWRNDDTYSTKKVTSGQIIKKIKPKGRKVVEWVDIHEWMAKGHKGKKIDVEEFEEVEEFGSEISTEGGCTVWGGTREIGCQERG